MTRREKIAAVAEGLISGALDPLTACRQIVDLSCGVAEHDHDDIVTIRAIESELDGFAGAPQRASWDPAALAEKDAELADYLKRVGPELREACFRLATKWRRR